MRNREVLIKSVWSLGALACIACAGSATESGVDGTSEEIAAPARIADPDGKVWIRGAKINSFLDAAPVEPKGLKPERDVSKMTIEEATAYFAPRMEQGGYEYSLRNEDARKLAEDILSQRNNPTHIGGGGEVPDGMPVADGNLEREAKSVIGTDDRININYAANTYPYNNHAQMLGGGHTCTAFKMVNHYTAVTAAHCVHSGSAFLTRKNLTFQAGSSTPKAQLPGGCYAITVPGCWDGDTVSCDYAVIRLRGGGPWCNYNDYNVGYLGYNTVSGCTTDIKAFISGYPSDAPLPAGWVYPSLAYHYRADGWTSCITYPDRVWYYNDTTGGQSGTALVSYWSDASWRVRAIHHGSASGSNQGRRMTSDLYSWLSGNAGY